MARDVFIVVSKGFGNIAPSTRSGDSKRWMAGRRRTYRGRALGQAWSSDLAL